MNRPTDLSSDPVPLDDPSDRIIAISPDPKADLSDLAWFRENPLRTHRLRFAMGVELGVFGLSVNAATAACLVIRQTTPGTLQRLAVWGPADAETADEPYAWAAFEAELRARRGEIAPADRERWFAERVRQLRQAPEAVVQ